MAEKAARRNGLFPLGRRLRGEDVFGGQDPRQLLETGGQSERQGNLTARLIDRPLRPLFPKGLFNDVSVVATALSVRSGYRRPNRWRCLALPSRCPSRTFPLRGRPVAWSWGSWTANTSSTPRSTETDKRTRRDLNLTVSGTKDAVMMVEAGAKRGYGRRTCSRRHPARRMRRSRSWCAFQEQIVKAEIGKPKREMPARAASPTEIEEAVRAFASDRIGPRARYLRPRDPSARGAVTPS